MYLPLLNAVLCGLLVLAGLVGSGNGVVLGLLPALVYGTVLVAKTVMADVDPERELSVLKYEYKGA